MIGYTAGMALYALIVVALYPAFKNSTSLDTLVKNDATGRGSLSASRARSHRPEGGSTPTSTPTFSP